ncbi:hypothetical protein JNB63_14740 [Microbacterium trichothecenolyticum]|uniref:hypothetical protein n=1 Tax=Microbacterium trichothecenolyticum TaxID=69370 RepID=UPI001C6DDC18|nr:hypothetical protein [Microbacterium trichothecenolyticum]MBW9121355.1 hypothetical protein [Microbacterium trichothecenolyticum]
MTEQQLSTEGDSPPSDPRPSRRSRFLTPRTLGIGSALAATAAAVALVFATQTAVQATSSPETPTSTPIAADSTDEDAPEKATEVPKPTTVAAAYDGLTGEEVEYVRFVGAQDAAFAAGKDLFGEPGLQFLSTDVADPQAYSDGHRRLLSLYYDYATDETVSMIVNVTNGAVESVDRASGTQPAPTDAETSFAWELLLADDAAQPVVDEFAALTGGSVLTPASAEVLLTAHSLVTDAGSFGAESCGVDRCVQVLAQVDGGAFLTTSTYVVNLSTRAVLTIS